MQQRQHGTEERNDHKAGDDFATRIRRHAQTGQQTGGEDRRQHGKRRAAMRSGRFEARVTITVGQERVRRWRFYTLL
jgi:hypothetical protein